MFTFYVLSSKCTTWTSMDSLLASRYKALLRGEKPRYLTNEQIIDLVTAVHVVEYADDQREIIYVI